MHLAKKMMALLTLGLLVLPLAAHAVVINEIRIDQPGTDYDEYFELYGQPGESLDGLTYVTIGDGLGSGTIETAVDLTGYVIQADGFFVGGESSALIFVPDVDFGTALNFENSDNVTHMLVEGFTGAAGDDLDLDDDCVLDVVPWTNVVDTIGFVETVGSGDCLYGTEFIGPDGFYVPGHIARCLDGGPWFIADFDPANGTDTPGDPNLPVCGVPNQDSSWGAVKSRF